jgi:medium-chain acyl-[acyl-carrier-protein] hydrolase
MRHKIQQSTWVHAPVPRRQAQRRLFCFPYAGGGASIYRDWGAHLPPDIELCAVRLPGREGRFSEPMLHALEPLLAQLVDALLPAMDRPFALFGHSLGALVAFELARALRARGLPTPLHVFVSGRRAPHLPESRDLHEPPLSTLPDAELIAQLRRLEGTPDEVLSAPELLALMLPMLRADFAISESYEHRPGAPLDCPITAFGGLEDKDTGRDSIAAWSVHTRGDFTMHVLPGGHFFLHTMHSSILHAVANSLAAGRGQR